MVSGRSTLNGIPICSGFSNLAATEFDLDTTEETFCFLDFCIPKL